VILTTLDYEEQNVGYQAAFSRLAASQPAKVDPVAYVTNSQAFMQSELAKLINSDTSGMVRSLVGQAESSGLVRGLLNGQVA
jgi:exportin-2 (importin alpha re-exporter)